MKKPEPELDTKQLFLVVRWTAGSSVFHDCWLVGDGVRFSARLPGDGTLIVTRSDRREPAATYGVGGWSRFMHEMRRPSEISEGSRADLHLPR